MKNKIKRETVSIRKNVILKTPSGDQFNEPNTLSVIVWKIKQLLIEAGYTSGTIQARA